MSVLSSRLGLLAWSQAGIFPILPRPTGSARVGNNFAEALPGSDAACTGFHVAVCISGSTVGNEEFADVDIVDTLMFGGEIEKFIIRQPP